MWSIRYYLVDYSDKSFYNNRDEKQERYLFMKIVFTGAQSTGKTTLVHEMQKKPAFNNYNICDNITRHVTAEADRLDLQGNQREIFIQNSIIDTHLFNITLDNFLADRCAIDCYVYGMYQYLQKTLDEETRLRMVETLKACVPQYDYIFYIEPEFGVIRDGTRSDDPVFQEIVSYLFCGVIHQLKEELKLKNIFKLTGSVEERLEQIDNIISEGEELL